MTTNTDWLQRYSDSLLGVFGTPALVLSHGDGCYVWDMDGKRYLDLLGGIAVNALGHGHPALVSAVSKQASEAVHISNFFTSPSQVMLAERLLQISGAPQGSKVFFANSGTEAIEAAIKLARRTGRPGIIAAEHAFHGRSTGALALTHKAAYREPFEPLLPGVVHVPYDDPGALRAAVGPTTSAVVIEPVQGEAGVIAPAVDFLRQAREITSAAGALLIIDEIQTGIGRTGAWFGFQHAGIVPDAITIAKGLGGGVPIGAMITFGADVSALLTAGQHGTTFGGNPLAAAAGLAVLGAIEDEGLIAHATQMGKHLENAVGAAGIPHVTGVRGQGLLRAISLDEPISAPIAATAREAGFIINPVAPDAIRLAPPLVIQSEQLDDFVAALPGIVQEATR